MLRSTSHMITSLELAQWYDCLSTSETTLDNIGKWII